MTKFLQKIVGEKFSNFHTVHSYFLFAKILYAFLLNLDFELDPHQLGVDFKRLRRLLNKFPAFKDSSLIGPDVNQLRAQSRKAKVQKALKYLKNVYEGSLEKKSG